MKLTTPLSEADVRSLQLNQTVQISGKLYTGRDAVHKFLYEGHPSPVDLTGQVIYHCGPVVVEENGQWVVKAAGPTTSIREEPYQWKLIQELGLRAVIGKGGMGDKTREACQQFGCVYLHAVGGAAQVLAQNVMKVHNVYLKDEFGSPEAIWELEVKDLTAVVTIDAHGNSLHREVAADSEAKLKILLGM